MQIPKTTKMHFIRKELKETQFSKIFGTRIGDSVFERKRYTFGNTS